MESVDLQYADRALPAFVARHERLDREGAFRTENNERAAEYGREVRQKYGVDSVLEV